MSFGAPGSFEGPLDGLASRSRGSDSCLVMTGCATSWRNVARVNRVGTFPKVIPTGPWILGGLKRVLAGTRKRSEKEHADFPCETLLLIRSRTGKDARDVLQFPF